MSQPIIEKLGREIDRSREEFETLKRLYLDYIRTSKELERLARAAGFSVGLLVGIVTGGLMVLAIVKVSA